MPETLSTYIIDPKKLKKQAAYTPVGKLTSFIQIGTFSSLPYRKGRNLIIYRSKKQIDHYN